MAKWVKWWKRKEEKFSIKYMTRQKLGLSRKVHAARWEVCMGRNGIVS